MSVDKQLREYRDKAIKDFNSLVQTTLNDLIAGRLRYEWDYNGSVDKYSHLTDYHVAWQLPNGGKIRVCIRPCAGKDAFPDKAIVIACCKLKADNGLNKMLVLVTLDNIESWRVIADNMGSIFHSLDSDTRHLSPQWAYRYAPVDAANLRAWITTCDEVVVRDYGREVDDLGKWVMGANSRKSQSPSLNTMAKTLLPFLGDPLIHALFQGFKGNASHTTPKSQAREAYVARATNYLSALVREVSSDKWKTESHNERQKKADELRFWD